MFASLLFLIQSNKVCRSSACKEFASIGPSCAYGEVRSLLRVFYAIACCASLIFVRVKK